MGHIVESSIEISRGTSRGARGAQCFATLNTKNHKLYTDEMQGSGCTLSEALFDLAEQVELKEQGEE